MRDRSWRRDRLIALSMIATLSASLPAQDLPTRDSIVVPIIGDGRDPRIVVDGWKYFYFWRADTSFDAAYTDIAECYRFLPGSSVAATVPSFVPWTRAAAGAPRQPKTPAPSLGLVAIAIGAMVSGPLQRRLLQSRMRRCMEPRGYQRHPASKAVWEKIVDDYSTASIGVQAKLASGPPPASDPLPVTR